MNPTFNPQEFTGGLLVFPPDMFVPYSYEYNEAFLKMFHVETHTDANGVPAYKVAQFTPYSFPVAHNSTSKWAIWCIRGKDWLPWLEYPYPLKNLVTVVPVLDVPARYDDTRKDEILYWQREYLRGRIYTMIEFVMKFSHRILVHVSEDKALTSWDMLVGDAIQLEDYICVDCELSRPEAFRARFMETLQSLHC